MDYRFASDNTSGVCPEAWDLLTRANSGSCPSYGDDRWTAQAADAIRGAVGGDADVYFVFNGTSANALSLAACCQSYHSVICADTAHIETDECGAPEFFSNGTKLLIARSEQGKVTPAEVDRLVTLRHDLHYPKPRVLSLTQPTELGSLYSLDELRAVAAAAKRHGLAIHLDGARLANAVVALGTDLRTILDAARVDVLCLGGVKDGLGFGEAVVFRDRALSTEFSWRCKQAGQLASKMRFLAAPWAIAFQDGLWQRNAATANHGARTLGRRLAAIPGITLARPVEANGVFVQLEPRHHAALKAGDWAYYTFIGGAARFMCSWATTPGDIDELVACLERA